MVTLKHGKIYCGRLRTDTIAHVVTKADTDADFEQN